MANTYTQLFIHVVFVVKCRQYIIRDENKDELYKYISGIIQQRKHKLYIINGAPDHIHILLGLNPEESVSSIVKEIKRSSSMFINEKRWYMDKFEWQPGYAAFTHAKSQLDKVYKYIENQDKHHRERTFMEEYLELLEKFEIKYDKRYIFESVLE